MSSDKFVTAETCTDFSLGDTVCVLCNQSYSDKFYTFGACDHKICSHCFEALTNLPKREYKCPICRKGKNP